MDTNTLFIRASREAFRYQSMRGELTTEQLWHLPLIGRSNAAIAGFDLDTVARTINAEIKAMGEESFVEKENPKRGVVIAKLEVVKAIIATKQAEIKAAEASVVKAQKRRALLDALEARNRMELSQSSKDELEKQLVELDAE